MVKDLTLKKLKKLTDYFLVHNSSLSIKIRDDLDEALRTLNNTGMALLGRGGGNLYFISHDREKEKYIITLRKEEDIFEIPEEIAN